MLEDFERQILKRYYVLHNVLYFIFLSIYKLTFQHLIFWDIPLEILYSSWILKFCSTAENMSHKCATSSRLSRISSFCTAWMNALWTKNGDLIIKLHSLDHLHFYNVVRFLDRSLTCMPTVKLFVPFDAVSLPLLFDEAVSECHLMCLHEKKCHLIYSYWQ